jgi:hypothetical protein
MVDHFHVKSKSISREGELPPGDGKTQCTSLKDVPAMHPLDVRKANSQIDAASALLGL